MNTQTLKPSDLRIGNYVNVNSNSIHYDGIGHNGYYFEIEEIKKDTVQFEGFFTGELYQGLDPIPLTEEWILKLGLEKLKNVIPIYSIGKIEIYLESDYYPNGRVYFNSWCILKEMPKYVHQLQNLFYALTGEELEVKN